MCSPKAPGSPRDAPLLPTSGCSSPPRRAGPGASWHWTVAKAASQSSSPCCDTAQLPALREPISSMTVPKRPHTTGVNSRASTSAPPLLSPRCNKLITTQLRTRSRNPASRRQLAAECTRVQRAEMGQGHDTERGRAPKIQREEHNPQTQPSLGYSREMLPMHSVGRDDPKGAGTGSWDTLTLTCLCISMFRP